MESYTCPMNARTDPQSGPAARAVDPARALTLARDVLATEAAAITALSARLGAPFVAAVEMIINCRGRIVVSGIGKSGHIGRKLAATSRRPGRPRSSCTRRMRRTAISG